MKRIIRKLLFILVSFVFVFSAYKVISYYYSSFKSENNFNKLKEQIEKDKISFVTKSGKDGKIFGTISTKQIHEELLKLSFILYICNIKKTS